MNRVKPVHLLPLNSILEEMEKFNIGFCKIYIFLTSSQSETTAVLVLLHHHKLISADEKVKGCSSH